MRARISRFTVLFSVLTVIIGLILAGSAFAASDNILSGNIKEADGTTGQNTNSGSGVKTGHIQDEAVTTAKIVNGAVTAPKLGIVCPDGQYLQYTAASGWVCSVGTPGPAGPQGPQGPVGPTPHYANVIVVAKSGGDFTSVIDALNSITDNSETNPYLVKVSPGVYDVGTQPVQMKPYVDIEGSGESVTIILGNVYRISYGPESGLIQGASNAELRNLTVQNSPTGGVDATVMYNANVSPKVTNVSFISSGTTNYHYGIRNVGASPTLKNVSLKLSSETVWYNTGIRNEAGSSPAVRDMVIDIVSGPTAANNNTGIENYSSTLSISNTKITVSGGQSNSGITSFDSNQVSINNVFISVSGGTVGNMGISCTSSTIVVRDSVLEASGGNSSIGFNNYAYGSPTLINVVATAKDAGTNFGVLNHGGQGTLLTLVSVIAEGPAGTGLRINQGDVQIDRSTISGTINTISASAGTTRVGSSYLKGGPVASGSIICAGVYDENYVFYANTCP